MTKTKNDYEKSHKLWHAWREEQDDGDPIQGFCNWEQEFDNFKLECWNVIDKGVVIFQFWPDGNGFTTYESPTGGKRPHHLSMFLGYKIHNSWNSDGYVLIGPDGNDQGFMCHLGNYKHEDDAKKAALFYFMLLRPEHFGDHIASGYLYGSGIHLIYNILLDVLEDEGFKLPKEIRATNDLNKGILFKGEPLNHGRTANSHS